MDDESNSFPISFNASLQKNRADFVLLIEADPYLMEE